MVYIYFQDDDGEDLFGDNMERDYRPMPELERYDPAAIDDDDFDLMSEGDRAVAEAQMRRRDKEEGEGFQNVPFLSLD